MLPVRGKVYLKSQQEDAAQEPKQAVLRGALLALHCMAGGSAAERQGLDMDEAGEEYNWCTYSVAMNGRSLRSSMHRTSVVRCPLASSETPALACVPHLCAVSCKVVYESGSQPLDRLHALHEHCLLSAFDDQR